MEQTSGDQGKDRVLFFFYSFIVVTWSKTLLLLLMHAISTQSRPKVPNVQPGGSLLELLLCVKGRSEAFIRSPLVSIQSRRDDVHHIHGGQIRVRLLARRPGGQPPPPGSRPLHGRGVPRPGAQPAADTKKSHPVPRRGDGNFVLVHLVDPSVLRHWGR